MYGTIPDLLRIASGWRSAQLSQCLFSVFLLRRSGLRESVAPLKADPGSANRSHPDWRSAGSARSLPEHKKRTERGRGPSHDPGPRLAVTQTAPPFDTLSEIWFSGRTIMTLRLLLFLCALIAGLNLEAARFLAASDAAGFAEIAECALSPDGKTVATISPAGNIQLYSVAGGAPRALTTGKFRDSSIRWSPDGSRIAFFSNREGATLWVADVASGKLTAVANVVHSNFWIPNKGSSLEWSPDSRRLAFVGADPSTPAPATDPRIVVRLQYKSRTDFSDDRREHIWIVDATGGRPRPLTRVAFHEHSISWSGNVIAFVSNRGPDPEAVLNCDLYTVDETSGVIRRLTDTPGCEYEPVFSPDGSHLAFLATTRVITTIDSVAEDAHVWAMAAAGGRARELNRALDRRSSMPRWSRDGRDVYFLAGDRGRQLIYRVPAAGGVSNPVFENDAVVSAYSPGSPLAYLAGDGRHTATIYADGMPLSAADAEVAGVTLSAAVPVKYRSFDGTSIEGWMLPPARRVEGRKYPLLLNIHGGPHGMHGVGFSRNLRSHILAAAGYAVLSLNPRGSSGYGQEFSDGCVNDWGGGDYKDLMAGVDHALARFPWLDASRMGVLGSSYGGYMTNWVITQTNRFRGAVSSASLSNLISFYATSLYNDLVHAEFKGFPWAPGNYDRLWQRSPLKHVAGVETPTLFIHGEQDNDVHVSDAEQMYTALRQRGVTAELARYPREGHGFTEAAHKNDTMERTIRWFDRFVKGPVDPLPETLALSEMDLHLHSGMEREATLEDWLDLVVASGRKFVALVDHLELYRKQPHEYESWRMDHGFLARYPVGAAGHKAVMGDFASAAKRGDIRVVRGWEIYEGELDSGIEEAPMRMADVIGWHISPNNGRAAPNGQTLIKRAKQIKELQKRFPIPMILFHPFTMRLENLQRSATQPLTVADYRFFQPGEQEDLIRILKDSSVYIEIARETERYFKDPACREALIADIRPLARAGLQFTVSTDSHGLKDARAKFQPEVFAEALGITPQNTNKIVRELMRK